MTEQHPAVETIDGLNAVVAYVLRASASPDRTTFITPDEATMQAGYVVYPAGGEVTRHDHKPVVRSIVGTAEFIVVHTGRCEVDLYDEARELVATRELVAGDAIVLLAGGHGFKMIEDTVLLEVKQGPYTGLLEKERF